MKETKIDGCLCFAKLATERGREVSPTLGTIGFLFEINTIQETNFILGAVSKADFVSNKLYKNNCCF